MEVTEDELRIGIKNNIELLREATQKLTFKTGNPEYHKLKNKLSVQYANLKYHQDPEFRLKKLNQYSKWYEANKKTNEQKKNNHKPIYIS